MTIHKEGYKTIAITALVLILLNILVFKWLCCCCTLCWIFAGISLFLWLFIISFFRIPNRNYTIDEKLVIAPCDGKVVVIEETIDEEYFKGKVLQVSIFMSPANVHVNRNPISGEVVYNQYHKTWNLHIPSYRQHRESPYTRAPFASLDPGMRAFQQLYGLF